MRTRVNASFDIAIVGAGFAGSLLALICRRLGRSVVLLEKNAHPRFAIGESSTPLANLLLEELATRYDLPRLQPLAKWGTWQREYPHIACGLKRGFTFYHHRFGERFTGERRDQLLVAASPHDAVADTHWYRAEFDHFLVQEVQDAGVEYRDHVAIETVSFDGGRATLAGNCGGQPLSVKARLVLDATGPRGFLHRALALGEAEFPNFPRTQALYCHFHNVARLSEISPCTDDEVPPYPVDAAAVHHVFPGGWIWVLRFNNGVTSAGVAATDPLARELDFAIGSAGWQRLLDRLPTAREQFAASKPVAAFRHSQRLAFQSRRIAGAQWALLPSAAGFVDPLLSTGFALTLLGIGRLADLIAHHWATPRLAAALQCYETETRGELLTAARLVAALYAQMEDPAVFSALSRIYFAAASFSECARRLSRAELAGSFLMHDVVAFAAPCRSLLARAMRRLSRDEKRQLITDIERGIEPFDIAGLCERHRCNWHPVDPHDLIRGAGKLGMTVREIERMLTQCGFEENSTCGSSRPPRCL